MTLLSLRPAGSPEDIHRRNYVSETKQNLSSQWTKVITHKLVTDLSFSFPAAKQQQAQKTGRLAQAVQGTGDQKTQCKAETSKAMDSGGGCLRPREFLVRNSC